VAPDAETEYSDGMSDFGTRAETLLGMILEQPESDAHRLVLADLLEENGADQYAEFIRVQCALARADAELVPDTNDGGLVQLIQGTKAKRERLRARESALYAGNNDPAVDMGKWGANAWRWFQSDLQWADEWTARRGFVQSIKCTAADWLAHGQDILRQQPIEVVEFTDMQRTQSIPRRDGPPVRQVIGNSFIRVSKTALNQWAIALVSREDESPAKVYPTRAALIDAVPAQLREWGVNGIIAAWHDCSQSSVLDDLQALRGGIMMQATEHIEPGQLCEVDASGRVSVVR
jgi:uncharacterized protein (TIGR02996 family)